VIKQLSEGVSIIIPAGGKGKRFGEDKQLFKIGKKPIIQRTIEVFAGLEMVDQIVVVTNEERKQQILSWGINYNLDFAVDGKERYNSVYNGLRKVKHDTVAIHDGARCLVTKEIVMNCLKTILNGKADAVFPAIKPVDTIRSLIKNKYMTPDRNNLLAVQTPQVFRTEVILELFDKFFNNQTKITDDISLVELYGEDKYIISHVEGSEENIKITKPFDIIIAKQILKNRGEL